MIKTFLIMSLGCRQHNTEASVALEIGNWETERGQPATKVGGKGLKTAALEQRRERAGQNKEKTLYS